MKKIHISRRNMLKLGAALGLSAGKIEGLQVGVSAGTAAGGFLLTWGAIGVAGALSACRKADEEERNPFSPAAAGDVVPHDFRMLTLRNDSLHPVSGGTIRSASFRGVTDADGYVRDLMTGEKEPLLLGQQDCLTYAGVLLGRNELLVRMLSEGSADFLSTLHHGGIIRLPPDSISVVYPQNVWALPGVPEVAAKIEALFGQITRFAGRSIELNIGPGQTDAALVVPVIVDPGLRQDVGGEGQAKANANNIVVSAWVKIREAVFATDLRFMFHELGHALLGLGHPDGPGVMDPGSMYSIPGVDTLTISALTASFTRSPGTEFYADSEADPLAKSIVASGSGKSSRGDGRSRLVCAPPRLS